MAAIVDRGVTGWFTFPKFYQSIVDRFPAGSRFVELGVYEGASFGYLAERVAASGKSIELFAVDGFCFGGIERTFYEHMQKYPVPFQVVKGDSAASARIFEDRSVDFVFIDACHEYPAVSADYLAWLPKVADGGVIAGHDNNDCHPGVVKLVGELKAKHGDRVREDLVEDVWWVNVDEIRS